MSNGRKSKRWPKPPGFVKHGGVKDLAPVPVVEVAEKPQFLVDLVTEITASVISTPRPEIALPVEAKEAVVSVPQLDYRVQRQQMKALKQRLQDEAFDRFARYVQAVNAYYDDPTLPLPCFCVDTEQ